MQVTVGVANAEGNLSTASRPGSQMVWRLNLLLGKYLWNEREVLVWSYGEEHLWNYGISALFSEPVS